MNNQVIFYERDGYSLPLTSVNGFKNIAKTLWYRAQKLDFDVWIFNLLAFRKVDFL